MVDLSSLNNEQRLAAQTLEGPLLILAGAGSGKTRALTYRIANLLSRGVPAWQIMAITFTNKAAKEMRERVEKLAGADGAEVWVSTFHASCAKILRRDIEKLGYTRSFTIYDDDDQMNIIKEVLKKLNIDEKFLPPREVKSKISDAKNTLQNAQEWFDASARDFRSQMISDVYRTYEEKLRQANALDFDDLLVKTLELFTAHPPVLESYQSRFRYIHVDEYQDTNYAQYMLVKLLAGKWRNLCVVGDDDQSIYGWRGADIRNILDFEKDFPDATVIKLEQNYRSTANILAAANQVIAHNAGRKEKALWTQKDAGNKIILYQAGDEHEEAAWICERMQSLKNQRDYSDFAVLYRTNAQSRVLEEMLVRAGIPYRMYGGQRFYDRKEVRDIIAYLRVIVNSADDVSLRRIINQPKRAIGDATVNELIRQAAQEGYPLFGTLLDPSTALSARARKNVMDFGQMMTRFSALSTVTPLGELVEQIIDETGLERQYTHEDNDENRTRIENIREFVGAVKEFEEKAESATLADFLENVALVTDLDGMSEDSHAVTLMTLHSAKGLEFPIVFMCGMEEELFPSFRAKDDEEKMEEERRLCYVGITRAQEQLFLSYATRRMLYNQVHLSDRSRFISEIPERLLDEASAMRRARSFEGMPSRVAQQPTLNVLSTQRQASQTQSTRASGAPAQLRIGRQKVTDLAGGRSGALNIPGVQKGFGTSFVASGARESEKPEVFAPGDRVQHRKFGEGSVVRVTGSGSDARIAIEFAAYGVKEFALSIAPIVKVN